TPHGLGNVVELQVREHLVAALREPRHELEAARRAEELEPHLVEPHRIAEALDQRARLGGGREVKRDDQALGAGNRGHVAVSFAESWRSEAPSEESTCFQCSARRSPVRSGSSTKAR